jgi:hypothetical protein
MVLAIDLNWPPDEDQHGIPDLNEVPVEDEQQAITDDIHGGSENFFPFDLNISKSEQEDMQQGKIYDYLHG